MSDKNQDIILIEEEKRKQNELKKIADNAVLQPKPQNKPSNGLEEAGRLIIPNGYLMLYENEIIEVTDKEGDAFPYELSAGLYYCGGKPSRRSISKTGHDGKSFDREREGFFPTKICNAFKILAEINNKEGNDGSLILGWRNRLGTSQSVEVRAGDVHVTSKKSELFRELTQSGLEVPANRVRKEAFEQFLLSVGTDKKKTRLETAGWNNLNGKDYYALPVGEHFPASEEIYTPNKMRGLNAYQQKGTLEAWKNEVASYADSNRLLALGICLSFAGSLLKLANWKAVPLIL